MLPDRPRYTLLWVSVGFVAACGVAVYIALRPDSGYYTVVPQDGGIKAPDKALSLSPPTLSAPSDSNVDRTGTDDAARSPNSVDRVEPTSQQASSYRALMAMSGDLRSSIPAKPELSFHAWELLRDAQLAFAPEHDRLFQKQAFRLREIARERDKTNSLEAVPTRAMPPGSASSRDALEQIAQEQATFPNRPGQLVSLRSRGGVTYINRVNPGEDVEIDELTTNLRNHAILVVEAINAIILQDAEAGKPRTQRR